MHDTNGSTKTITPTEYPNAVSVREQVEIMRAMLDRLVDLPDQRLNGSEALNLVRRTRGFMSETLEYIQKFR